MTAIGGPLLTPFRKTLIAIAALAVMASCAPETIDPTNPWAPGVDHRGQAEDGLEVGHRLMAAQEYELALEAFTRAALDHGMTGEVLSSLSLIHISEPTRPY